MYNFLFLEEWWMDLIISALITGGAAILAAWIFYNQKVSFIERAVEKDLPKGHDKLSGEHDKLSGEHDKLSGEHTKILDKHNDLKEMAIIIKSAVLNTSKTVTEMREDDCAERAKEELRYNSLSDKHKGLNAAITDGVDAIKTVQLELGKLSEDNSKLSTELAEQKHLANSYAVELAELRDEYKQLHKDAVQVDKENKELQSQNQRLVQQMLQLQRSMQQNSQQSIQPTNEFGPMEM